MNGVKVLKTQRRKEAARKGLITRLKNQNRMLITRVCELEYRVMIMEEIFNEYDVHPEQEIDDRMEDEFYNT